MRAKSKWPLCLLLCAPALTARAHDPPQVRRIVWSAAQSDVLLQTNRGLIFGDPATQAWRLLCNEAMRINSGELPSLAYLDDGRLLVATSRGLRSTDDRGCSWRVEFEALLVPALAQDPSQHDRIYIATFPLGEASENVSGNSALRVSDDGAATWTTLRELADNDFVNALRVAPGDAQRVYASGTVYHTDRREFYLARSDDAGQSWQRFVVELTSADDKLHLLAVSPSDPDLVLVRTAANDPINTPERLLLSRDGGESWSTPASVMMLRDAGFSADGTTLWLAGADGLHRSNDSGESFARVGASEDMTCAIEHDGALHACGWYDGRAAGARANGVGRSQNHGDSYEPWMTFQDVTEAIRCGDGTMTDALCQTPFADWRYELANMFSAASLSRDGGIPPLTIADAAASTPDAGANAPDAAQPAPDSGTPSRMKREADDGCSVQRVVPGNASGWLWLAPALFALSRRRAGQKTRAPTCRSRGRG